MGIMVFSEFCYIIYLEKNDTVNPTVEELALYKPRITTSCTIWRKILFGLKYKIEERERSFEFNRWIDVTDFVDIKSRIDSPFALLKIEVELSDVETEQAYTEHVEQFSKEVRESFSEEEDFRITSNTIVEVGQFRNEKWNTKKGYSFLKFLHWSFTTIEWFYWLMVKLNIVQTVTVKKIVSRQTTLILGKVCENISLDLI